MKCKYCGTELLEENNGQNYCNLCGAKLSNKLEKEKQKLETVDLISFRRAELNTSEVEVLKELEWQSENVFTLVEDVKTSSTMSFSVKNNHITGINLYLCSLTSLPKLIEDLKFLEYLYLSDNDIKILPESIGNLKSLKHLNLHSNKISILPESIGNLTLVNYLDLWDNDLKTLPNSIGDIISLQEANFGQNKLISLPESIGNLTSLKKLHLFNNELKDLPESILNLKALRSLDIRNNHLETKKFRTNQTEILLAELEERGVKIKR